MKTVCLFDIDGTLLNSGGAGQHAMEQALAEVFGLTGPYTDIPAAGRTDWAITTDLFAFHQLELDPDSWQKFLKSYLGHLPASLSLRCGGVLPGVVDLLNQLSDREDVALGLLTGNVETGARAKLRHYDLDHHFPFGGFGDEFHNRDDVARSAHAAARKYLLDQLHADRVWVIGDTPADVQCARAIGARVIAVATGIHTPEELEPSRPDRLLKDLSDIDGVLRVLL
ncbi:HAD family hydrolase [Planctomicrobium sp. SH664]|uniref:HAD family hydrolase n=1 Tax=Planctomicrobium sp. SH664 TaxID=3448125 RepID=UPI003F5C9155